MTPLTHILNLIGYQMMKRSKTHISFNKQPMEYNDATLAGRWQFLVIELLQKTIKNQKINIIYDHNSMFTIKKIITKSNSRQIKSKQNSLTYTSLEKIWDQLSMRLVNKSTKSEKTAKRYKVKKFNSNFEKS